CRDRARKMAETAALRPGAAATAAPGPAPALLRRGRTPASALIVVAVPARQRSQELQRRLPGGRRIEDAEMRRAEIGVELPLACEVERGRALQERAVGEIMRVAVAILGRHTRQHAVL